MGEAVMPPDKSFKPPFAMLLMLAIAGCAPKTLVDPAAPLDLEAAGDAALEGLPARFAGDLPCASCPGVRHVLELQPDGTYAYRMTYLDRGDAEENSDDIGRWVLRGDRLTLRGGREAPQFFAVRGADTIEKFDLDGEPIESALDYTLTRAPELPPLEPELHMRGMYRYLADAAVFEECITGWQMPVSMGADNPALERAYAQARSAPGEPVLINLIGRVAHRPAMEGDDLARALVPVQFINAWPGQDCGPASEW
jgi:copper homeostasis protein (lipoprotein)